MEMTVTFGGGMKVNAHFNDFTVNTDQPKFVGGEGTAPDPFAYFLTSLATCAGFFVARFCQTRDLSTGGIQLRQFSDWNKEKGKVENIRLEIELPPSFPEKYAPALIRAVNECTVKKTLMNPPKLEITTKVRAT
ncbi:MAG: osmotically inducible protein C [Candidatus Parabeggiatoa sp. nov. 1]|nr:MAG: osmotically inducible protein C [Gammaproteobacteria bacterium]